jgi:hypothetical protein
MKQIPNIPSSAAPPVEGLWVERRLRVRHITRNSKLAGRALPYSCGESNAQHGRHSLPYSEPETRTRQGEPCPTLSFVLRPS